MSAKLSDAIDDVPFLRLMRDWTDEQWAAHDARIAADAAKQEAEFQPMYRRAELASWPRVAVEDSRSADENSPAIQQLKRWDADTTPIALLSGGVGCGKTTAAAWIARHSHPHMKFARAATFARVSRYGEERAQWMDASALTLDDLGTEYADAKGALVGDLEELIDTYCGDRKPLLITTNLGVTEFKSRYGDRITDRIRQHGKWMSVNGESLRRRA